MNSIQHNERVVQELTGCQVRLYSLILTLLPSPERAQDVLQETNLTIWKKSEEFDTSRDFWPWAAQVARVQVMAHLRDTKRDRLVFDEGVVEAIAVDAVAATGDNSWRRALIDCLSQLPPEQRKMVRARYVAGNTPAELSATDGRSEDALRMLLYRVRQKLLKCIRGKLPKGTL